jgi:CRP-like cAMP-binding protein
MITNRSLDDPGADGWEMMRALALGGRAMSPEAQFRNRVLGRLTPSDLELLQPHLEPVDLPQRYRLAEANRPIESVYFLESGLASMASTLRHELPVEVGMVGREGVVNVAVLLGSDRAPSEVLMQLGGSGLRIAAGRAVAAMESSTSLARWLLRSAHVLMVQAASSVLANARATVNERLARWLLMAHDRADSDEIALTHEFLSMMLGVHRPGVTLAINALEDRGAIAVGRGRITVLNRASLEALANGHYGMAEAELRRIFDGPE